APFSPTAHPCWSSVNLTAFSRSLVPEVCGAQDPPLSMLLKIVPEPPTTYQAWSDTSDTARSSGAPPPTTDRVHDPPLSWLRQILPLSPTTTTLRLRAATSRSVLFPS